ncbi:hypothetical protein ACRAWD_27105 [Caulobacter segnis]
MKTWLGAVSAASIALALAASAPAWASVSVFTTAPNDPGRRRGGRQGRRPRR